jgi:GDP-fucose transporter C1
MVTNLQAWKAFVPLALARVVGVLAKTYCLAAVDASFYQIARGLLLPFTLILSYLFLPSKYATFPPLALGGAGIVICGFGIGMISDMNKMLTSSRGLVLGVGSSMTTAIESIVVKRFVGARAKETGEGVIQMVWMSNVIAIGLYVPVLLFSGELSNPAIQALLFSSKDVGSSLLGSKNTDFLWTCTLTGLCSFLLTLATFLQIRITSPVTHMIVTAARGVAQSAIAVALLPHETIDKGRVASMVCILGGSALYGWAEDRAMVKREAEKQLGKTEEGIPMMEAQEKR